MDGISTSARCSSKLKRRRVDAIREFPRVCGIFPVVMDSRDGEDYIVDHVQPPQNPVTQAARRKYPPPRILKGSSVQRDFPSGFGRRDLHSASKVCLPNAVSSAKPVQKASVETAVKKSHPPGMVTDFSARQVCSAVKQSLFSVSRDISSHGCGKQNSFVSQENASENSYAGNQNLGSVSKKIFAQNKKKSIVADLRSMRSDGTLGNKETGGHRGSSASCDKVCRTPKKIISARHRAGDLSLVVVVCLNLVRWSRHLVIDCRLLGNRMYWSRQRFAGKGLVVVREGISTPNAPYLR
ncbi:YDG domain-containing protein [Populus alba x Populus x berolinensis]|nr:YDG domain-containing protein [Populus alba x Populus x berolinensis]